MPQMNKKLLALAVGTAFSAAPMFASAEVTVYGHAQVEVGTVDNGTTDQTVVEDNARGRIGFKASEKLGNGMTAIAKYEFRTDTADNVRTADGGPLTAREAFVGLKGGFGTVQLGTLKSAYKYSGGVKYDPFVATLIEARGANGMTGGAFGHNGFLANSIGYMTPKIGGGFTGWATFSPDENGAGNGADGDYSFGLQFAQKSWEVFVAGVNDDSASYESIKVGGQYKFGNFKVSGQYEMLDTVGGDVDVYFLGGQAKFGNNVLVAQVGNTDPDGGTDLGYYTIGVIHNLSKKTRLTAGFRSYESNPTTDVDTFAVGMRMKF
jgi:predicted porin